MGLNARDIKLRLFKVFHVSIELSYTYMRKHPLISGALLVLFILYIFLSYIYNLLIFLSPFLVCTALFVIIFWSSEQNQPKSVKKKEKKGEEKKVEFNCPPKLPNNERRGLLYKCPSQNATSRRRNFTGKKLDVYGGLEIKAKDLSAVFRNEFTKKNTLIRRKKLFEKDIGSSEAPTKQALFSESSMLDQVTKGANYDCQEKKVENKEDVKKAQEDKNKVAELTDDDQKNQMDLGIGEVERNKRLESLIARRKARRQLKLQLENGLIDMNSVIPSHLAPLFITRPNPFDSPRDFEDIEMPGSAPTALRSPFDLPYDPFEEKPILTGDSFAQEFTDEQKEMLLEPSQDPNEGKEYRLTHPTARRLRGKRNEDKPEQLISKEASENESKAPIPPPLEEDEKCEVDMVGIKGEEMDNVEAAPTNNLDLIATTNMEGDGVAKPQEILNLPISSTSATEINDSLYEALSSPEDKKQEKILLAGGPNGHNPSCSLASDLQVEISEAGSPTPTVDESHDTATTTDGDSIIYDGDIDKDVTSGSEDMWGASLHSREVRRISEQDISEVSNWRDIGSPMCLHNIDEENAADVSSMSSISDMPDDTPTYTTSNDNSIFSNKRDFFTQNGAPQPYYSSEVLQRWRRLTRLMDTRVNHMPHEMHSQKPEEVFNLSENLSRAQDINDVNNSAISEQDNTHSSRNNEEPSALVMQQEATSEASINSSSPSSPRSILSISQKTLADQDSLPSYNQDIQPGVQQCNMEDEVESHNDDLNYCKEQTSPSKNFIQEPDISSTMNGVEVCNKEDEKKLKNNENNEEKSTPLIGQDTPVKPSMQAEMMASGDISEISGESIDVKVPLISLVLESTSEQRENEEKSQAIVTQEEIAKPCINVETTDTSSDEDFEGKHKNEAIPSSCISARENDKLREMDSPKHNSEEVNYLQSESKQVVEEHHVEKEKLDKVDTSQDLPQPIATKVINFEDTKREYDKMNKNEGDFEDTESTPLIGQDTSIEPSMQAEKMASEDISEKSRESFDVKVPSISPALESTSEQRENEGKLQALVTQEAIVKPCINAETTDTSTNEDFEGKHKNEAIPSSCISARESDKLREMDSPNHNSEEVNYLQSESKQVVEEDHVVKEKLDKVDTSQDLPPPISTEVINFEDTKGEYDKMNKHGGDFEDTKSTPLIGQDTSVEPSMQAETKASEDISEKSRESFDVKVPSISPVLESTSEQRENEEKSQALVTQEAIMKPCINAETTDQSTNEDFEGKHKDEAIPSSCISARESNKSREMDSPKHNLEEVNYMQSDSKQVVEEDHVEKGKLDKVDTFQDLPPPITSQDLPPPIATQVINFEDTQGEYDKMNKKEGIDQLNKNETVVLSKPEGEIDQESNIAHTKDHEERTSS